MDELKQDHRLDQPEDHGFPPAGRKRETNPELERRVEGESEDFARSVTPHEAESVGLMSLNEFGPINRALYQGHELGNLHKLVDDGASGMTERAVKVAHEVDAAISKAPLAETPRTLYRGVRMPKGLSPSKLLDWAKNEFKVGETAEVKAFQHTSIDPAVASDFAHANNRTGVVLEMQTRKGAPIGKLSKLEGSEGEYLQPRNGRYRVVGISERVPFDSRYLDGAGRPRDVREIVIHVIDEDDLVDLTRAGGTPHVG